MDRKSLVVIVVCVLLLVLMNKLANKIYPPIPVPVSTNQIAVVTNGAPGVTNEPAGPTNPELKFTAGPRLGESLLVVTNENARYTFTSRGGGLREISLVHYPETVIAGRPKIEGSNGFATLNADCAPPILSVLGDASLQGDGNFALTPTANGVRAEKTLPSGVVITKDFELSTDYVVTATITLKNPSANPINLPARAWAAGFSTPMSPRDNGLAMNVLWHNGAKASSVSLGYFSTNTTVMFVIPRTVHSEYREGSNNVVWVSAQNQYFAITVLPDKPAPAVAVETADVVPDSQVESNITSAWPVYPKGLQAALSYPAQTLTPNQEITNHFVLYAGPKEYHTLARLEARFDNHLSEMMNLGFFGVVARLLLSAMNWMHDSLSLNYGLVIIIITAIIKFVFWPLTQASTRSMKRMQALQPQMKAIQEKYKDDPQKQQQKIWEFYRKNKVNPLSGCLPMFLQIPVFFGFFTMLRNAIELRGTHFLWMPDLSQPDTILLIPGMNFPVNPMPLIMGASMLWQARTAPMSPTVDATQQKIMRYMPLFMLIFMYAQPSGLALYWTVSNLLTILQTKLTKTNPTPAAATPAPAAPTKKK